MKCPMCDIEMRITDREGVEIDCCPQCRGIWLDRGKLERILARGESRQSQGLDGDGYDDRRGDLGVGRRDDEDLRREEEYRRDSESRSGDKRKEGFFSNLFDMFGD